MSKKATRARKIAEPRGEIRMAEYLENTVIWEIESVIAWQALQNIDEKPDSK